MPDGPNDQHPVDEHEVRAKLQQRLEVALEVGRTGAAILAGFLLGLLGADGGHVLPRHLDGLVGR